MNGDLIAPVVRCVTHPTPKLDFAFHLALDFFLDLLKTQTRCHHLKFNFIGSVSCYFYVVGETSQSRNVEKS